MGKHHERRSKCSSKPGFSRIRHGRSNCRNPGARPRRTATVRSIANSFRRKERECHSTPGSRRAGFRNSQLKPAAARSASSHSRDNRKRKSKRKTEARRKGKTAGKAESQNEKGF